MRNPTRSIPRPDLTATRFSNSRLVGPADSTDREVLPLGSRGEGDSLRPHVAHPLPPDSPADALPMREREPAYPWVLSDGNVTRGR